MFSLVWKRIAIASALVLVLMAPFCVCYPPAVTASQNGCHEMPGHQPASTPACCTVSPAPQPLLATTAQTEAPPFLVTAIVVVPEPIALEQRATLTATVLAQSPPDTSSILRI